MLPQVVLALPAVGSGHHQVRPDPPFSQLIAKALWVCLLLRFFPEEKEMDAAQLQRQREYLSPQLRLFLA
jgi:hypothetical protein